MRRRSSPKECSSPGCTGLWSMCSRLVHSVRMRRLIDQTRLWVLPVLLIAVIGTALAVRLSLSNSGTTPDGAEAEQWCQSSTTIDGRARVGEVAARVHGTPTSDSSRITESDPGWHAACALAYELWGLSTDEWDWCADTANRDSFLEPTILGLGFGQREGMGTDLFREAPADNLAEYAYACRFAYRHRLQNATAVVGVLQSDGSLELAEDAEQACAGNPSALAVARELLEVGPSTHAAGIVDQLAEVRACRVAVLVAELVVTASPAEPLSSSAAPLSLTFEALLVNRTNQDIVLIDFEGGERHEFVLAGCSSLRINGEPRILPWTLSYLANQIATTSSSVLASASESEASSRVGFEVAFEPDGQVTVIRRLPVGQLPEHPCP